jgi:regulator of sigma E protease
MLTLLAFVVALGLLIAIHEYGHYRVAVACGVKVLKFSIGFGKPLYTWRCAGKPTEFSISALPLGGYVKMLDEGDGPVDAAERHLAFNNKPLRSRAAVVAAGPIANLLLAVLLYSVVNWGGTQEPRAVLATPVPESMAARAGLVGGEWVSQAAFNGEALEDVRSFTDLRWRLTQGAMTGKDLLLVVSSADQGPTSERLLPLSQLNVSEVDAALFRRIGLMGPLTLPVIGEVMADGAAAKAGLQARDVVLRINDRRVMDGQQLREMIRASVPPTTSGDGRGVIPQAWQIERAGQTLTLMVTPQVQLEADVSVAKIGAFVGSAPDMVNVQYGFFEGLWGGVVRTWDVSALTVQMIGKMLIGEASLKNLSGPLTIADYAGKSATLGWASYLLFLALISVSLGVLNLLPLPVLDGGHLMYYLWEGVTGRRVSDVWMARLHRGGLAILLTMMFIAIFNDLQRLLG